MISQIYLRINRTRVLIKTSHRHQLSGSIRNNKTQYVKPKCKGLLTSCGSAFEE